MISQTLHPLSEVKKLKRIKKTQRLLKGFLATDLWLLRRPYAVGASLQATAHHFIEFTPLQLHRGILFLEKLEDAGAKP
jgi:hypothetical protein